MESIDRIYKNSEGKMFRPMNVEGGDYRTKTLTTPKLVALVFILMSSIIIPLYLNSVHSALGIKAVVLVILAIINLQILRYVIFEEKMYYRMYKETKGDAVVSPTKIWGIASIDDTEEGAILNYSDGKIGIVVKLIRGAVVGRGEGFINQHYSYVSDSIRNLVIKRFRFGYMNLMETSESDSRVSALDKLIKTTDNAKLDWLVNTQVGHLKRLAKSVYGESEYFIICTDKFTMKDTIIREALEALDVITNGAYDCVEVLSRREVNNCFKMLNNISYFNPNEISDSENSTIVPFIISGVVWSDGTEQKLTKSEQSKIKLYANEVMTGTTKSSLKKLIYRKDSGIELKGANKAVLSVDNISDTDNDDYIEI